MSDLERAAAAIGARLPWLTVHAARHGAPDLGVSWRHLLDAQRAGADATRLWREALGASTARQYGVPPPPAMPAAFVLQWVLEVPATMGAYAAVLGPWAPDLTSLSFDLAPRQHYPVAIQVRSVAATTAGPEDRLAAARTVYRDLTVPFAETFRPGVKLGARQRLAMVDDVWAMTVARAVASAEAVPRASCCYIFTLPGAHECAGCPRMAGSQSRGPA